MDVDIESKSFQNKIFQKASPQARLGAFLIDGASVGSITFLCVFLLGMVLFSSIPALLFDIIFFPPIFIIVFAVYNTIFHSIRGQTVGKKLIRIKLVSNSYADVSFLQTLLRETLGKLFSSLFFLGFVEIVINQKRQGWQDRIASTYVAQLNENYKLIPISKELSITKNEKILFYVLLVLGIFIYLFIIFCFLWYSLYPLTLAYYFSSTSSGVTFPY